MQIVDFFLGFLDQIIALVTGVFDGIFGGVLGIF